MKLTAFALSGGIAGLAGGLLVGLLVQFSEDDFLATDSMTVVAVAVVGGLASLTGTVLGSLLVVGLPAFFPDNDSVALLTSGAGLLVLLLYFPGGLVQLLYNLRDLVLAPLARRRAAEPPGAAERPGAAGTVEPAGAAEGPVVTGVGGGHGLRRRVLDVPDAGTPALRVEQVTVRFGARTVVDRADLVVARGEVVGLIGANGAGKSTLMHAVGGFVPSKGRIEVLGRSVHGLAPHRRAGLGLGRTFQDAALFPDLTVRETVQTALEARGRAGFVGVALALPRTRRVERAKRARADEILDFLGLGDHGERFVSELSTGMRRLVELACVLATDARVLCLDEPTAGIAQREAEAFGPLLRRVRDELDASMLVIEHDMPLVMSISDRIYCLEAGRVIASGPPDEVRHDPRVVASYLGTDERAIARSGTRATTSAASGPAPPVAPDAPAAEIEETRA